MFYEMIEKYQGKLHPFTPYAPASDRDVWDSASLDEEWKSETVQLAESYLDYTFPGLPITSFLEFTRTGNRTHYEDVLFGKRQALCALVLGECVENKGRFMDAILNGIFSIAEESAWFLPAHNTYIRDTPQLPIPDSTDPVLELFSCETGAVLATAFYLLRDKLDAVSPFIGKRIRHELKQRVFEPYLNRHFWWMGNGQEPMCNWTIWCTQNVLLSWFLAEACDGDSVAAAGARDAADVDDAAAEQGHPAQSADPLMAMEILRKACRSADYFLAEYGEDGCCDEGAQYYHHAGLCLYTTLEVLNAVTAGAFAALFPAPKIRNIAAYLFNVHVADKYYINYADCSPIAGRAGAREFLFAQATGNPDMMDFAARDFVAGGRNSLLMPEEHNLYYRLQNGFSVSKLRAHAQHAPSVIPHKDIFYPSAGLFLVRDDVYTLACKAGDNDDSHNHNDTGSFTIYKNGMPLFIDIGVESYTQKTFSDRRYEIWTMQSAYHNLPTIDGHMQMNGGMYRAEVLGYNLDGSSPFIEMDIAKAYPDGADIESYIRKAVLKRGQGIEITDRFCFAENEKADSNVSPNPKHDVILNFITYEKPVAKEKAASSAASLVLDIGTLGSMSITGGSLLQIESYPITDPRLQTAWKHEIYRIQVRADASDLDICIC